MADICPVCTRSISFITKETRQGINLHFACIDVFDLNPEKYGGKAIKKTEADIATEIKVEEEFDKLQKEIKDKSVYVKGFSMPFGEMVEFMVKWAIASIPAFIILFIIFGILFLIFGSLFF